MIKMKKTDITKFGKDVDLTTKYDEEMKQRNINWDGNLVSTANLYSWYCNPYFPLL